jgi:hypothetical protein
MPVVGIGCHWWASGGAGDDPPGIEETLEPKHRSHPSAVHRRFSQTGRVKSWRPLAESCAARGEGDEQHRLVKLVA